MNKQSSNWKKGRGKLGVMDPLLGSWCAEADTPKGPLVCIREFERVLDGSWIMLKAKWNFSHYIYKELALYGAGKDGILGFWSFTSDKKRSEGRLADVSDLHPQALGFEARMDMGLARTAYWPDEVEGIHWVVESRTKKGWNRFVEHHYKRV